MSFKVFRNVMLSMLLMSCFSCTRNDHKENNSATKTNSIDTASTIKTAEPKPQPKQIKTLNYDNWDTFWKNFTSAARKKDTATIIALTNFPFLQNSYLTNQDEFTESWSSQPFDLRENDAFILWDNAPLQMEQGAIEKLPKFDSVRYAYKKGKDFYFAKVNGYYRLVEIITPG